jgi:hypothetical protein
MVDLWTKFQLWVFPGFIDCTSVQCITVPLDCALDRGGLDDGEVSK